MQWNSVVVRDFFPGNFANVQLQDTKREKEIMLGPDYPYPPLEAGECIINSLTLETSPNLKVGDAINMQFGLTELLQAMAREFNENVKEPGSNKVEVTKFSSNVPCVIKDIMSEPYGKYPSPGAA